MQELKLMVPTYLANLHNAGPGERETTHVLDPGESVIVRSAPVQAAEPAELLNIDNLCESEFNANAAVPCAAKCDRTDFGETNVPVLIHDADGVRIVLGTHDYDDREKADIQIERRLNGWAIFLHPVGGGDPCGYVYFLDDGRSFLVKEKGLGATAAITVLEQDEPPPELDQPL